MVQDGSLARGQHTQTDAYSSPLSKNEIQAHHASFHISDPFFQQIIGSLEDDAVFTIAQDSTITSWSSGAEKLFGYSEKDILGQNVAMILYQVLALDCISQQRLSNGKMGKYG